MAEFWNSILTEKSWNILKKISKDFKFIVIGSWAAYLWTKMHKSKDIDIALTDIKELSFLKREYDLKKNDNLKKYEISFEEIDVGIYAPYFSKLPIPIEDLKNYTAKIENITVVKPEVLLILKQGAEIDRELSVKGQKDRIDIMTLLLFSNADMKVYIKLLKRYNLEHYLARLKKIISSFNEYEYLNLDPRKLKLKKKEMLEKLKNI